MGEIKKLKKSIILLFFCVLMISIICFVLINTLDVSDTQNKNVTYEKLSCETTIYNQTITGILNHYEFRAFEGRSGHYPPVKSIQTTCLGIISACKIDLENYTIYGNTQTPIHLSFPYYLELSDDIPPENYYNEIDEWGYYHYYPKSSVVIVTFDIINGENHFVDIIFYDKPENEVWKWDFSGEGCE